MFKIAALTALVVAAPIDEYKETAELFTVKLR